MVGWCINASTHYHTLLANNVGCNIIREILCCWRVPDRSVRVSVRIEQGVPRVT
jgi:hypothetical protein